MRTRSVDGYTLVEVLVAALVLAAGVVGMAGAHLASMRTRTGTALTSGGVQLASALAERMRANAAQMQAGDALNPYLQLRYDAQTDGPPAPAAACFGAAGCGGAQMAAFDLYEFKRALHAAYPAARAAVCRDAPAPTSSGPLAWECTGGAQAPIVVKLGWRAPGADAAAQVAPSVAIVVAGAFP